VNAFREAIVAIGLDPPPDIPAGKWIRFSGIGKKASNKAGWCLLFEDGLGGIYGDYSSDLSEVWQADKVSTYSPEEMVDFKAMIEKSRAEAEKQREKDYEEAARRAQEATRELKPAKRTHPYLKTKNVAVNGLLAMDDNLVMPLTDATGAITTYQTITPDGVKKLMYGGKKKGSVFHIKGKGTRTYVVEGYATGATVHEATGSNVFIAVDAGNIMSVVEALVDKEYKDIVIAADNDHSKEINTGVVKAKEVALKFQGVSITYPPELPDRLSTDWNDFAEAKGIGTVAKLLFPRKVDFINGDELVETEYKKLQWAVEGIIPEGLTILAGAPKLGKSWLMLGLAYAVSKGILAWGFGKTRQGNAYYLALEDSRRRIKDRLLHMEGYINEVPKALKISTKFPRIGEGFIEELDKIKEQDPHMRVVIIDTLQKIRPVSNGKRMIYQAEYEDYEKLQHWSIENGIPVICVHHTRKGDARKSENPFDEISGSTGIQGVADTLIVCQRPKGTDEGTMFVTGREVSEESYPMTFSKETMTWTIDKPEENVDVTPIVWDSWFANNDSITVKDACKLWNINQRTARERLEAMVENGLYIKEKVPHEGRGRPLFKYSPKEKTSEIEKPKSKTDPWG
jgi:putative DNA primase/helicase